MMEAVRVRELAPDCKLVDKFGAPRRLLREPERRHHPEVDVCAHAGDAQRGCVVPRLCVALRVEACPPRVARGAPAARVEDGGDGRVRLGVSDDGGDVLVRVERERRNRRRGLGAARSVFNLRNAREQTRAPHHGRRLLEGVRPVRVRGAHEPRRNDAGAVDRPHRRRKRRPLRERSQLRKVRLNEWLVRDNYPRPESERANERGAPAATFHVNTARNAALR
mmetsp:Transcript_17184/g.56260  ORF Transcript_17184/g.56260 Transcript_17184/m.56260 type:complete len:222 (-) Transcript_17184:699-1364(-)